MTTNIIVYPSWGPQSFQKAVLKPGDRLLIGQSRAAGFQILHDKNLDGAAAELVWDGHAATIRAVDAGQVMVNGSLLAEGPLRHASWFRLGETTFMLCHERHTPPRALPDQQLTPLAAEALGVLRGAAMNVYAVLDAARDPRIIELLRESPDETRSLYEGVKGDSMAAIAPYLVLLDPQSWLLEALVAEGLGRSWGLFLDCPLPFKEMRRHLRRLLMVHLEGEEELLYFRFYDPRVIRTFLPSCTPDQLNQFYGPIKQFWAEDGNMKLLRFAQRETHAATKITNAAQDSSGDEELDDN